MTVNRPPAVVGYDTLSSALVENDTLELQAAGEDLDAIVCQLPLEGVRRVLDVGCGSGALTRAIARRLPQPAEIWGVDLTASHVNRAQALAAREGVHAMYFVGDIFQPPAGLPSRFDLVCEKYVLMNLAPRGLGDAFIEQLIAQTASGGSIALIEADINFGSDRFPPPPEPLATVLPRIVMFYRERGLIEWRCGVQLFDHLRRARLADVRVRLADGRVMAGGSPWKLVAHANTHVEQLVEPCLVEMGIGDRLTEVCEQWRAYLRSVDSFVYNPVFVGSGKVVSHE